MIYTVVIDGEEEEIAATGLHDAVSEARDIASEGDWGTIKKTVWATAHIHDEEGVCAETITVAIDPDEPSCEDGKSHDWQAPHDIIGDSGGVWSHGGGIRSIAVCVICGCGQHTDTWATRPDTGEQGLTSVRYVRT